MATAVYLDREPRSAFLVLWGRRDHSWWGCITFQARVTGDNDSSLAVAAWVPADAIRKAAWAGPEQVSRIVLPADCKQWPAPPGWPAWYAGVSVDGPLVLPAGVEMVTGAAWRNRPPRGSGPNIRR